MTEEERARRLAYQMDRVRRARTIRVPCGQCGVWTRLPDLYRCYQCGFWLCLTCGAEHWPEAATKRDHAFIAVAEQTLDMERPEETS